MVQNELHSKAHTNKLLNCSLPLHDPFGGDGVNKVMFNVIYHTPQQFQKVLPDRTAKAKSLHKVSTVIIDCL